MFVSTGGGPSFSGIDQPLEIVVVLLMLAGLVWLAAKFFGT